jgi:hypothetical protein
MGRFSKLALELAEKGLQRIVAKYMCVAAQSSAVQSNARQTIGVCGIVDANLTTEQALDTRLIEIDHLKPRHGQKRARQWDSESNSNSSLGSGNSDLI